MTVAHFYEAKRRKCATVITFAQQVTTVAHLNEARRRKFATVVTFPRKVTTVTHFRKAREGGKPGSVMMSDDE